MKGAELTREEITDGIYSYHLHLGAARKRLYRGRGYYFIRVSGDIRPVYFNKNLFPQFNSIPMRSGLNDNNAVCWEMEHEYRQTEGGASAPYEIIK